MECPHLTQSVRLGSNDIEWNYTKNLPFVCAGNSFFLNLNFQSLNFNLLLLFHIFKIFISNLLY